MKQKQSSFIKNGPAFTGVTLKVDVPVLGFSDDEGKMNLNVAQVQGSILLVSQFTLAADTTSGNRPGFSTAAPPEQASNLCNQLADALRKGDVRVETGRFGADMQVALVNDGPVTFLLEA